MNKNERLDLIRKLENDEIQDDDTDFVDNCSIDLFLQENGSIFGMCMDLMPESTSQDLVKLCDRLHIHYEQDKDCYDEVSILFKDIAECESVRIEFKNEGFFLFDSFE